MAFPPCSLLKLVNQGMFCFVLSLFLGSGYLLNVATNSLFIWHVFSLLKPKALLREPYKQLTGVSWDVVTSAGFPFLLLLLH